MGAMARNRMIRRRSEVHLIVIARHIAPKQSSLRRGALALDCFAALAMTGMVQRNMPERL